MCAAHPTKRGEMDKKRFVKISKVVDKYLFPAICFALRGRDKPLEKPKKILLIKLWAIGDSILTLPLIDALRNKYTNAQIDVLAHNSNKCIYEGYPHINKIHEFGIINAIKLFGKYDLVIDCEPWLNLSSIFSFFMGKYSVGFSHKIRSNPYNKKVLFNKKQHMVQNYLDFARAIGIRYNTNRLSPFKTEEVHLDENDKRIVICPGIAASVSYRMWPIEKMADLGDKLLEKGYKVLFIDSPSNREIIENIQKKMEKKAIGITGLNLNEAAFVVSKCKYFIGNDSGMMHVAAAMGVKTIGLFGPNTPVLWGPYGEGNVSIFKPKEGCPYLDNTSADLIPNELTQEQMTCMDAITVQDVLEHIE